MEPVGLAVGVLGLAGLFSSCLDVLERFDSWRDFGADSRLLAARFKAEKIRLEQWGQAVGFGREGLLNNHHTALDDPRMLSMVEELLSVIRDICHDEDVAFRPPVLGADSKPAKDWLFSRSHVYPKELLESKRQRLNWVLRDKARRIAQVEQFGLLVEDLHNLVPLNGANVAYPRYWPTSGSDGALMDRGAWIADFGRILIRVESEIEAETKRELQTWLLGRHSPNELYDTFIQKRIEGSCDWILTHPSFVDWSSPDSGFAKLLWINGPAGFGKSVLCARIINHLSSTIMTPIAHFFFSSDFQAHGDPFMAIRSWISQVIFHPTAFELVRERWAAQYGQIATHADIVKLLREVIQAIPGCIFILDGLDECTWMGENQNQKINNSDSVADFLETVKQAITDTTARIMIVSRDEPEIRYALVNNTNRIILFQHKISPEDVRPDTILYSRSIVDRKLPKKTEALKDNISRKMADYCKGQFLWLKLQEDSLRSWKNQKQLQDAIDRSPTGLEHLYERNWMKILQLPNRERIRAFSLLRWAAFALRPLTIREITEALLISDDSNELLMDEMPDTIDEDYIDTEILGLCGSLLEIRSSQSEPNAELRTVHLAHFSVKQYLLSNIPAQENLQWNNKTISSSREVIESNILARLCLRYVNFQRVWLETSDMEISQNLVSFRDYAAGSWYQHATMSDPADDEVVKLVNKLFDTNNSNWNSWRVWFDSNDSNWGLWRAWFSSNDKILSKKQPENEIIPAGPLYYAAWLGLTDTVNFLIEERKYTTNETSHFGLTVLEAACLNGNLKIVQILLKKGADIAAANNNRWTPLHTASYNGHTEVVKLLLENGADITITSNAGWTPLHCASYNGHTNVVKLLLEKGADITAASNNGWTPLHTASEIGHTELVKLLLEKGADITIKSNNGWTPLHWASYKGYIKVVKLLLENGADITFASNNGWTPLHWASHNGHIEVVKLLLEKGADITLASNIGRTPLHLASYNGHIDVVKLLLRDSRANANAEDNTGRTPLFLAATRGRSELVQLLLSQMVTVNSKDQYNSTPLFAAVRNGHDKVVEQLLALEEPSIDFEDGLGRTLFWWATKCGNIKVVELVRQISDIQVFENDFDMECCSAKFDEHLRWCDVCTRCIPDDSANYKCGICNGGDFDICLECFETGVQCLNSSHEWVLDQRDGTKGG